MVKNLSKISVTIFLMLTIVVASMAVLFPVNAANPTITEETSVFLSVAPNPVGVGQTVTLSMWIYPIPPTANDRYTGLQVEITYPDGTKETKGPATGAALGNYFWSFIPAAEGTYRIQGSWPGATFYNVSIAGTLYDVTRSGDIGPMIDLVVQTAPILPMEDIPQPTEYWTHPINAQNRLWASLSGSWLTMSYNYLYKFNPYTTSPKTAHVLWKYQQAFGGIEGGPTGTVSYASGTMYEAKVGPGIIINNRWYQYSSKDDAGWGDRRAGGETWVACKDIATGETIWCKQFPGTLSFGQIYEYNSVNQVGVHAYLWRVAGTTWTMFDAYDGEQIMELANASSGSRVDDYRPKQYGTGDILQYMINTQAGWMAMWNFTKCMVETGAISFQSTEIRNQFGAYGGQWRPSGTRDWQAGIQWNVTIPHELFNITSFSKISGPEGIGVYRGQVGNNQHVLYAYDLSNDNPRKLWGPVYVTATSVQSQTVDAEGNYIILANPTDLKQYAFDLRTGTQAWISDPATYPWGSNPDLGGVIAYGNFYIGAYDGLHAYNLTTGKEVFHTTLPSSGLETPYGTWIVRTLSSLTIGDEKVFFSTGAWHPEATYERGDRIYCANAYTGELYWNFSGFYTNGQQESLFLASGHLIALNEYDQTWYCFNKGPSAITVDVSSKVAASRKPLLITGTVTDESPAAKELVASGKRSMVPAIADIHMTEWMEYLYQQQPRPWNLIGVPVFLQAMFSNGTVYDIGEVYSDGSGNFAYTWTPPINDQIKILATFCGSDSYWGCDTTTSLLTVPEGSLGEYLELESTEPETIEPIAETPFITTELAVILAVTITSLICVAAFWAFSKRK